MKAMPVTEALLDQWSCDYAASPERRLAALALSKTAMENVAFDKNGAENMKMRFSVELETLPVANQEASGRCWLFAATNVLRERIAKKLNLEAFELSQSYLAFWDKFERANYFLESIIETAVLPADDRTVAFILATGVHDGGQWDMFANIVRKYGIVPKDCFSETWQSSHTNTMNYYLNRNLKITAAKLRGMIAEGASDEAVQALKNEALGKVYAFLCSCYGVPPTKFDFEWVDKDKKYGADRDLTPKSFFEKYIGDLLENTVSVINAPTADKPYHQTYTIRMLGNVVGGRPVCHLNLTMDEFKQSVIRQLEAGKVVWFGSDVGHYGARDRGIWDDQSFNAELLTGLDMDISKADGLDLGFSAMNHAMVITGVNIKDGKPDRWKIENSWGDKNGDEGYYICSDTWFDQYVYQAAIEREYLGDLAQYAAVEPVELAPWDPMGTLAD